VRHGEAVLSSASFIRESFLGGECAPTSSIFLRGDRRACRCIVTISDTNKNGDKKEECGQTLVGKNATNLRNHLRSKHKKLYADIEATETQSKREKETKKLSSAATQVQVTKISTYYSYTHLK
jgi:hypothetical protein